MSDWQDLEGPRGGAAAWMVIALVVAAILVVL